MLVRCARGQEIMTKQEEGGVVAGASGGNEASGGAAAVRLSTKGAQNMLFNWMTLVTNLVAVIRHHATHLHYHGDITR